MDMKVREARQQFCQLLDRVEKGEEVIIRRRGRIVARLVPPGPASPSLPDLREFRQSIPLSGPGLSETVRREREEHQDS